MLDVFVWSTILFCVFEFFAHLKKEWETIRQAPLAMILVAVISGASVWFLRENTIAEHKATNEKHEATIRFLQAKNDDLKEKVGTDVPSEIKKRIDKLEELQAQLRPRRLSEETASKLMNLLVGISGGDVVITHYTSVPDSKSYSDGFIRVFSDAGWNVRLGKSDELENSPASGIAVAVPDPQYLTQRQTKLMEALRAAGISFDIQHLEKSEIEWLRSYEVLKKDELPDAEIRISHRPI